MIKPKYDVAEVCGYKKCKKFHMKKGAEQERKRILKIINEFVLLKVLTNEEPEWGYFPELKKEIKK